MAWLQNIIIIFSMAILVGIIMFLSIGGIVTSKQISDIPEKNEVSFIEIYHDYISGISKYHSIEGDEAISEIYNVLLSGKKNKTLKSHMKAFMKYRFKDMKPLLNTL